MLLIIFNHSNGRFSVICCLRRHKIVHCFTNTNGRTQEYGPFKWFSTFHCYVWFFTFPFCCCYSRMVFSFHLYGGCVMNRQTVIIIFNDDLTIEYISASRSFRVRIWKEAFSVWEIRSVCNTIQLGVNGISAYFMDTLVEYWTLNRCMLCSGSDWTEEICRVFHFHYPRGMRLSFIHFVGYILQWTDWMGAATQTDQRRWVCRTKSQIANKRSTHTGRA